MVNSEGQCQEIFDFFHEYVSPGPNIIPVALFLQFFREDIDNSCLVTSVNCYPIESQQKNEQTFRIEFFLFSTGIVDAGGQPRISKLLANFRKNG
jgi:hypothetical protein